ncbi:hypothetical protein JYT29_01315 [Nitrospina gracilis]|nr:hypothetical protein [Nitrospina gracilis]
MDTKFINLDRTFAPIPKSYSFNEEEYESELTYGLLNSLLASGKSPKRSIRPLAYATKHLFLTS